jgi:hypothetical protein
LNKVKQKLEGLGIGYLEKIEASIIKMYGEQYVKCVWILRDRIWKLI